VRSAYTSGTVTDDSDAFRLANLEFEVVGGACGGLSYPGPQL